MNGEMLITELKNKLEVEKDSALAEKLGMTPANISTWRNSPEITVRQIGNLISNTISNTITSTCENAISTIVEFFPIVKQKRQRSENYDIFSCNDDNGNVHNIKVGIQNDLNNYNGVYIFFDSLGRPIYVGKAKDQKLWAEICNAFNRDRKAQEIRIVQQPIRNVHFNRTQRRQIKVQPVRLHEIAYYFSAYRVDYAMIDIVESILIRPFVNVLLNTKVETLPR